MSLKYWLVMLFLGGAGVGQLFAGGSGLNVAVVVNQNSANSAELGNYFCARRAVPPQNVLRIDWTGGNVSWSRTDFENALLAPLRDMLADRRLTNQIDYIVLSMDIPYRVTDSNGVNSTTAALFYGFKPDNAGPLPSCTLPSASRNAYAASESAFRDAPPATGALNAFLCTQLTAGSLAQAKHLVDQGVNSDGTFSSAPVWLAKSSDIFRNIRFYAFDNAVFNTRLQGNYQMQRVATDSLSGIPNLLGLQTGLATASVAPDTFAPGALADSLTSYGGFLFEESGQTSLLEFIHAGAAGSYGTVVEPCNYLEKFPDPQNYFYQARGFSLAECYYQSLTNPYQGLIVGEPLAAPFARAGSGNWISPASDAVLSGTVDLALQFNAADPARPLQQVDLFLDGTFLQTLTNLPPRSHNVLHVTLNGRAMNYTVPNGATIKSTAAGLTAVMNGIANRNATRVNAVPHGDRIELQSTDPGRSGADLSVNVSSTAGTADATTTFLRASRSDFLDSIAWGRREFDIAGKPQPGSYLQINVTKTNGTPVTLSITNQVAGKSISLLVGELLALINSAPALQGDYGLITEDAFTDSSGMVAFNLRARGPGLAAAQVQVQFSSSTNVMVMPETLVQLDENLVQLQARNHLFVTAGSTSLQITFPLDTTTLADGFHELIAVAYEGSHVRTQTRVTQNVRVQNSPLNATLALVDAAATTAGEATFHFSVTANTNTVTTIELFSTGGSLGIVSNLTTLTNLFAPLDGTAAEVVATFAINGPTLGLGSHLFYAVVTAGDQTYRTAPVVVQLVGVEAPFALHISGAPDLHLNWPAIAGRRYDVLGADNVAGTFAVLATVTPTSTGLYTWPQPVLQNSAQRFYRIRVSP